MPWHSPTAPLSARGRASIALEEVAATARNRDLWSGLDTFARWRTCRSPFPMAAMPRRWKLTQKRDAGNPPPCHQPRITGGCSIPSSSSAKFAAASPRASARLSPNTPFTTTRRANHRHHDGLRPAGSARFATLEINLEDGLSTDANPLGVKGSGQAGAIAAPQTIMNAILDALAPLGIDHIEMPATSETIWRAIHALR